ncbi:MAG: ATPase, partial [Candidatus Fimenecus sp.]
FYANRGLRQTDIEKAIRDTVPLSATQREQILELRAWAKDRAVLATAVEDREPDSDASAQEDGGNGFVHSQGGRIVDFDL